VIFKCSMDLWSGSPPFVHRFPWVAEVTARDYERALYRLPEPPPDDWSIATMVLGYLSAKCYPTLNPWETLDFVCRQLEVSNPWEQTPPEELAGYGLERAEGRVQEVPQEGQAEEPPWVATHLYRGAPVRLRAEQGGPEGATVSFDFLQVPAVADAEPSAAAPTAQLVERTVKEVTWQRQSEPIIEQQQPVGESGDPEAPPAEQAPPQASDSDGSADAQQPPG